MNIFSSDLSIFGSRLQGAWDNYVILAEKTGRVLDLSIEGMRSQEFSVGMFFFLLFGIGFFSVIVGGLLIGRKKTETEKMRKGEMIMFGAIIMGIIVAIIMASVQMLHGYLI